ncbi:hypothetical protein WP1_177 [Pseudomonas phage WP1]
MKISLISYTQNAWELLLGTKSARHARPRPGDHDRSRKARPLEVHGLDTIRSPFEFVDFIFQVEGVSK